MGIAEGIRVVPGEAGRAHLGLLAVGGVDLLHGSDEVLDIVDPPARHAQGRVEHPQIAVDLYQVSHGDLPLDDHVPAVEHQDDGEGVGQDLEDRHVFHPHPGALDLGVPEPVVLNLELALLVFFLGESLHHPVAADVLLDEGVQGGEAVAVALESGLHLFGLLEGGDGREGQHHQHAQGQLRAHGEDHHQREDEQQHVLVHGVDDIGHEIPDGVHVSRLAAHQVAGALLIVKVEVLLQQLLVHGAAHVVEDALGGGLEHELVQEAQDAVEQRDPHQACDQLGQQVVVPCLDDLVHHDARYVGVDDGQGRDDRGQEQAADHQFLVLPQEAVEPFDRCHMQILPGTPVSFFWHSIRLFIVCGLMVHCTF